MNYLDIINHYPDFPKEGIDFIDILPFLQNKEAFNQLVADIDAHTHTPMWQPLKPAVSSLRHRC